MQLHRFSAGLVLLTAVLLFTAGACLAATPESDGSYCFSALDFDAADGIIVTGVPAEEEGTLLCGSRVIRAGDALSCASLQTLRFCPATETAGVSTLSYLPVSAGQLGAEQTLTLERLAKKANEPPTATDSELETYRNIANSGHLTASDPEGGSLTYTVETAPKRGEVTIAPDGTFTYTPNKNKVGSDSFTYTVTDEEGSTSAPATVSIRIKKPSDKATFTDMRGQDGEFYAMWMKEQGLLSGEKLAGGLCFSPDKTVSRGEFVVMVMHLFDLPPADSVLTSGFADEGQTPEWMQPYLTAALRAGIITGVRSEEGLVFRPTASITQVEAAVILQKLVQFPAADTSAVDDAVAAWAADSVQALAGAGITTLGDYTAPLTRLQCAQLLYEVHQASESGRYGLLSWAAE